VIFDQFSKDPNGVSNGQIEVIDGRWGASLRIGEWDGGAFPRSGPPLLLYDVEEDPMALHPINDERPDLVANYTDFLTAQHEAHRLLAKRFTPGGAIELTAEQPQTLRTLGYIR
jgi:hypothetical protein